MLNTEDKIAWCEAALEVERDFVHRVAPQVGLDVIINPAKQYDRYALDLMFADGSLGDLKQQVELFRTSQRYKVNPFWCVTFNEKDYLRYNELYPDIPVVFWVKRPRLNHESVWMTDMRQLRALVAAGAPLHAYQRRREDRCGNATASYVLDVRRFDRLLKLPRPS